MASGMDSIHIMIYYIKIAEYSNTWLRYIYIYSPKKSKSKSDHSRHFRLIPQNRRMYLEIVSLRKTFKGWSSQHFASILHTHSRKLRKDLIDKLESFADDFLPPALLSETICHFLAQRVAQGTQIRVVEESSFVLIPNTKRCCVSDADWECNRHYCA